MRVLAALAVSALMLCGCGTAEEPPRAICNTVYTNAIVQAGTVTFRPGGKDAAVSSELTMTDAANGGKSIADRNARIGIVVEEGVSSQHTRVTNGGDKEIVLKTNNGCVHPVPGKDAITFGAEVSQIDVFFRP